MTQPGKWLVFGKFDDWNNWELIGEFDTSEAATEATNALREAQAPAEYLITQVHRYLP